MPVNADMGEIDESRMEGESWLDMRNRTRPERDARKKRGIEMAQVIADALNAWAIDHGETPLTGHVTRQGSNNGY